MAKAKSRVARKTAKKLTRSQVIVRILKVLASSPDAASELPPAWSTRAFWEKTFAPANSYAVPVLEVLSELPGFTDQAPPSDSNKDWAALFARETGEQEVARLLRDIESYANYKPIKRPRINYWREAFGKDEVVQRIRPTESFGYIPNPHRGTTTYQRFQGEDLCPTVAWHDRMGPTAFPRKSSAGDNKKYTPHTTLTYCRWPWEWMEPQKGKFNWEFVEATLRTARERGQTAQLRFQPYTIPVDTTKRNGAKRYPGKISVDIPDWYWDTGAGWIEHGPFGKNEPDSNDPRYLEHFGAFVRAFGERFDGHPNLESIDIAYAGFWGEAGGNCTDETARKLTDIYLESFSKTQLVGMLGTPGMIHAHKVRSGKGKPLGWRADSFGDFHTANVLDVPEQLGWNHMIDAYAQEVYAAGATDAWKTAPVTMETSATVAHWVMAGYDIDRILEEGLKYHTTVFMPKSVFYPESVMERVLAFDLKIGYRFALRQMLAPLEVRPGAPIRIEVFADNVGCAPLYRPYRLALRFKQGSTKYVVHFQEDIRRWLPGHNVFRETIHVPAALERGETKVALGIVDETDTPRAWFAIDAPTDDGWHPLTSMEVIK
jgi:hypothetical protein